MSEQRIPCIIPAWNEEFYIARTLHAIDADLVQPIVVVNGSTDNTAQVVRDFGLEPIIIEEQGKLPAVQFALRSLGKQGLGPILMTDADSVALRPNRWPIVMTSPMQPNVPLFVSGRLGARDTNVVDRVLRDARKLQQAKQAAKRREVVVCGANMAMQLSSNALLDTVLSLPHVWPGEDGMLADTMSAAGAETLQLTSKDSLVFGSGRFNTSLWSFLVKGRKDTHREIIADYHQRAARTVTHAYLDHQLNEKHSGTSSTA